MGVGNCYDHDTFLLLRIPLLFVSGDLHQHVGSWNVSLPAQEVIGGGNCYELDTFLQ